MGNYTVKVAFRNYDTTQAIIRGLVKLDGVDLQVCEMKSVPEMFTGMVRGEYDVSEFSMAELVYHVSRGDGDFIGIPVFPLRMFRHGFLFCNASARIDAPEGLDGMRIGFYRLAQTACVWIRGILVDEYHLSPERTRWYIGAVHNWDDGREKDEIRPPDGSVVRWVHKRVKNDYDNVDLALMEGEIDALGGTPFPKPFLRGDKRIRRVIENYREVEASYFRKTGIFPIMHSLVVRRAVLEEHPDLPEKLFKLFSQSKKLAQEWVRAEGTLSLAWKVLYVDEEEAIFQGDPWAYGLEKNQHTIGKFLSYCYDQGVSGRRLEPGDLFVPSSWGLAE